LLQKSFRFAFVTSATAIFAPGAASFAPKKKVGKWHHNINEDRQRNCGPDGLIPVYREVIMLARENRKVVRKRKYFLPVRMDKHKDKRSRCELHNPHFCSRASKSFCHCVVRFKLRCELDK
jgi:hypothetical protein